MLFNSLHYLVFFPVVTIAYFVFPQRLRWALLLVASYYFYMSWKPEYGLLLAASTLLDFSIGLALARVKNSRGRRILLLASIAGNLGLLCYFKYLYFFLSSAGYVPADYLRDIVLPIGISFYTFQTMSYTIEVYAGRQEPCRHIGKFALYVAFFPQLVSGPIERPAHLLPQFDAVKAFDYGRVVSGMRRIAWGLFKKIVIADRLAIFVDLVWDSPGEYTGPVLLLATMCFYWQIYCDFSGYIDVALGSARILGFDLAENFNAPFMARSVAEFWRRWHITLSNWLRDYLYIPLGGDRSGFLRGNMNVLVVFVLCGLWHGANWTYVVFGGAHAMLIVASRLRNRFMGSRLTRLGSALPESLIVGFQVVTTWMIVAFCFIPFRAPSLSGALVFVKSMGSGWVLPASNWLDSMTTRMSPQDLGINMLLITMIVILHIFEGRLRPDEILNRASAPVRWAAYYALILATFVLGNFDASPYIYFQF